MRERLLYTRIEEISTEEKVPKMQSQKEIYMILSVPSSSSKILLLSRILHSTINLLHNMRAGVLLPVITRLLHHHRNLILRDLVRTLHKVDIKAHRQMPGDMAMERPDTRIIGIILHHHPAIGPQVVCIATLWVLWVDDGSIPGIVAVVEDKHVVAVDVHGLLASKYLIKRGCV